MKPSVSTKRLLSRANITNMTNMKMIHYTLKYYEDKI